MSQSLGSQSKQEVGNFLNGFGNMFTGIGRGLGYLPDPSYAPQRRRNNTSNPGSSTSRDGGTTYSPSTYTTGGVTYDRTTGQAINPDTKEVAPGGYSINPGTGKRTDAPRPSTSAPAPSRQEPARTSGPAGSSTKTNANGVTQTGRNLSATNMQGLAELERYAGGTIANFAGPSFPTQADTNKITDGYAKATPVTANQALAVGAAFGGGDEKTAESIQQGFALGGGDGDAIINTNKPGGPFSGAPQATEGQPDPNVLKGVDAGIAADGGTPPNRAGGTLSKALADRANMRFAAPTEQGEGAKYAPPTVSSGEEMRRRSAFLDADTSLQGLRNVEGGLGYVVAGGNAYANVNGEMKQIDMADARAVKNAAPGEAQALKDKWVAALSDKKTESPTTPAEGQNPTEETGTAQYKAPAPTFEADKTEATSGIAEKLNGVPHTRDFRLNNTENDKPGFSKVPKITDNKPDNFNLAKNFYIK
jgi:hypothetical protein